ncbi:glucan biosynthesis: glycosyl transferase [uncultured Desulfobacterium sp.]|uniref:Glucans biosynthesis glucosyltransferase H n=1 Tax=uncultured Desulfobacterium sp. TaxID=201089 RepID=A0A445N2P4_9BACT|nr:glucan biosynthesis: glycosyl transferase [uncultured Desulfobacterium sp.]
MPESSNKTSEIPAKKKDPLRNWERHAKLRRFVLVAILLSSTYAGGYYIADILPGRGNTTLESAIVAVFAILFAWISIGFWEAMAGLFNLVRPFDRFNITRAGPLKVSLDGTEGRTAILMPICNEDVDRVFAGLAATYQSLEGTGQVEQFDFFVLSDSSDPDRWVEEEIAWAETCRSLNSHNHLFYRHRRVNLKRKSGNIADFCRRWGRSYKYMIVMDADSLISGETLVRMVCLMSQHPKTGIIQTVPHPVNRETLVARLQQFSSRLYGPMFNAGLHFMQLGDSHFWGHNAIIRVEPFMEHCGLPELPGKPPRGGYIMSHDFVEAAFMRRGGWEVWFAYELEGSYEEIPPTLLDELKREQRWCSGNIQHIRLLFMRGLFLAHRALFLQGVLSYVASPLWVSFLCLSTAEAITEVFRSPVYFPEGYALFPQWPTWYTQWAHALLYATSIILFTPKLLSMLLVVFRKGHGKSFGGLLRLFFSMIFEVLFAVLFAPVRMLFHTKFVLFSLFGRTVEWIPQKRLDHETGWFDALRFHGFGTFLGLLWGFMLFFYNEAFFWWNIPIIMPLILSVPLSVLTSRGSVGRFFRKLGLFLIPEELETPPVLKLLQKHLEKISESLSRTNLTSKGGFVLAVVDPLINALHRSFLPKERKLLPEIRERRNRLVEKALSNGPQGLNPKEKREILSDPFSMRRLHVQVWETSDKKLSEMWGL